jgi:hypothetical protein
VASPPVNDYVRRRHPGEVRRSSQVRIKTATRSGTCPMCSHPIVAWRSRIALAFSTKQWVHLSCVDQVARS